MYLQQTEEYLIVGISLRLQLSASLFHKVPLKCPHLDTTLNFYFKLKNHTGMYKNNQHTILTTSLFTIHLKLTLTSI